MSAAFSYVTVFKRVDDMAVGGTLWVILLALFLCSRSCLDSISILRFSALAMLSSTNLDSLRDCLTSELQSLIIYLTVYFFFPWTLPSLRNASIWIDWSYPWTMSVSAMLSKATDLIIEFLSPPCIDESFVI